MNKLYIIVFLMVAFLSGCATKTEVFSVIKPVSGKGAVVYVYRPMSMSNVLISPDVVIDDDKKVKVKSNEYTVMNLPEGVHEFSLNISKKYYGKHSIKLKLVDAGIYFLRIDSKMKFQMHEQYKRRFDILKVSNDIALTEIGRCRYQGKKKNKANSVQIKAESSGGLKSSEADGGSIIIDDPDSKFSISKTKNPFSKSR